MSRVAQLEKFDTGRLFEGRLKTPPLPFSITRDGGFNKMKIIAIDLATKKVGYAIFLEGTLAETGLIEATGENYQERLLVIRNQLIEKIEKFNIEYIILEEVPMNAHNNLITAHNLCVAQGVILGLCCERSLGLQLYFPNEWRSLVGTYDGTREGTKRDVQKQKAVDLVNSIYSTNYHYYKTDSKKRNEYSDDDICEAILLGRAFLKERTEENE